MDKSLNACPICGTGLDAPTKGNLEPTPERVDGRCGVRMKDGTGYCGQLPAEGKKRCRAHQGGAPRIFCSRECTLFSFRLDAIEGTLASILTRATTEARTYLRSRLWLIGNGITAPKGRRPSTRFWRLWLVCGHTKDVKARSRNGVLDDGPASTHCAECHSGGNGTTRVKVASATLETT